MPAVCAALIFALTLALAAPVHADATNDLFEAAHGGTASEVKAALSAGADPGTRDKGFSRTPLHYAAQFNGNSAVITALIEAGADLRARIEDGWTPLHDAAMWTANPAVTDTIQPHRCIDNRLHSPS